MIKCPYCAEQIQDEARKCRYCGEWLEQSGQPAASSTHQQTSVRLCFGCGQVNNNDSVLCIACSSDALARQPSQCSKCGTPPRRVGGTYCYKCHGYFAHSQKQIALNTANPQIAIDVFLCGLNDFTICHKHAIQLKDSTISIAVDTGTKRVCIIDCDGGTAILNSLIIPASSISGLDVEEDGYSIEQSKSQSSTNSVTTTPTGDIIARSLVGNIVGGIAGAVIGGVTAKKVATGTVSETTKQISDTVIRRLDLKIMINDVNHPLYVIPFVDRPIGKGHKEYTEALSKATHWYALLKAMH